jgi:2-C-methyl-D-erythritol 2,4-cyclodiphosphate synthase
LFLSHALELVTRRDWRIVNVDCTITAEKPKLTPWKPAIRKRLAELLEIAEENVNVKAKSGEAVGPVGRCEAIEADAIVLLQRDSK